MGIISERIDGKHIIVDIKSSNTKSADYNTETEDLIITFNNGVRYVYYKVPWKVFTQFRSAPSQGKYFITNIKSKFKFLKL